MQITGKFIKHVQTPNSLTCCLKCELKALDNAIMRQYLCLVCNQCPAYGRPCLYCAGCKELWYCSADCQELHWKYDNAIMPGWRAHKKECWFIAVEDILCEFLAHSLVLEILKWANRHGPIKKGLSKNENKDGGRKEVGASTGF